MQAPEKKNGTSNGRKGSRATPPGKLQTELVEMTAWVPDAMEPGCVFLLRNRFQLRVENGPCGFWAVLACPQCGTLGLITEPQYRGEYSVICGSPHCSCHFLIHDHSRLEYLTTH